MQSHNLTVFGLELSFKAKTDPEHLKRACLLLEERFSRLSQAGGHLSKEKLLAYLALALAADLLHMQDEKQEAARRIEELLVKIEGNTE